jgi:hypothetical protein
MRWLVLTLALMVAWPSSADAGKKVDWSDYLEQPGEQRSLAFQAQPAAKPEPAAKPAPKKASKKKVVKAKSKARVKAKKKRR